MGEENINNNGCDQFTRPEEILELQKYLRAIKEELAERTELGTDVIQMDPSYRAGNIELDRNLSSTGRIARNMNPESERIDFSNAILGIPLEGFPGEAELGGGIEKLNQEGHKDIDKLPDTKDTINVERIERLEKVREKLVGADTNSPRELETYVEKLDVAPERINLSDELIRFSNGDKKKLELSTERENLVVPSKIESLPSDSVKIEGQYPTVALENEVDKVIGEIKKVELSNERLDLNTTSKIDSLPKDAIKMEGNHRLLTLGEGSDRIPFLETKIDQLPNDKEPLGTDQRSGQEKLELGKEYSSLPKDQGMMFDPSQEKLPDAVLGIPGELDDVELGNTREDLPREGEIKDLSLSDFLDRIKGEDKDLSQLPREITSGGNIPQGQKDIDKLERTISEDGIVEGENNLPDSLDSFLTDQGIIPKSLSEINDLPRELLEDSYIEGEQKNLNLDTELHKGGYIEGEQKNLNLHTELSKDGYTRGEFEDIDKLANKLPKKDGKVRGEFEDIEKLANKLPKKDGKVRGEFEDIDKLANKLPKKDGKVRGEFEDINELTRKLPKKDGYTRGDFKKIKNLTNELPDPDGYPDGSFKEVEKLTKKLPEDGYTSGKFVDLGEELTKELPPDGYFDGDFKEIKELTEELPEDGFISGDVEEIKRLPNELPKDGQLDKKDLVEINKLSKNLTEDGKITEGKFYYVEGLDKKISTDGKIDGDFNEVVELTKALPEGGLIDGEFYNITDLPDELPKEGHAVEGDGKEIKKLTKDLPTESYIDGDFKNPKPINKLPKDGHIGEENLVEFKKLTKSLPEDGHIGEEGIIEIDDLAENLPEDGHIGEEGIIGIEKLTKELPEDGHIGEEGIVGIGKLTKELPEDGHIGEEGVIEFEELTKNLPSDGNIPGELEDIYELDASLPFDGHTAGDFVEIEKLTKELPNPDGYTQGDLVEISELDKVLSTDGLIHGEEEGPFSEEIETEELFQEYSSNKEIFSVVDGTVPNTSLPLNDDWEHTTPESKFYQYTGKSGGIYIDPTTREVKYDGTFQIPDGVIAKDTYPVSDLEGREGLSARHPLNLDNKEFDEIGGLVPDTEIPRGDTWEHRKADELDDKKFDEIGGIIPDSTIPQGDGWEHSTPEEKFNQYTGKVGGIYIDPITREVKYEGNFQIPDGVIAEDTFSPADPKGAAGLELRHPIELDNKEFDEIGGLIPENSRPKDEPNPQLYEWLQSLEKIDSGAGDLYHALLERAGHNLDGYYTYLMHYAENKDLSSGWGQKLAGILSGLGVGEGNSITLDKYKEFESEISSTVMKYYEKEGKIRLEQSHLPRGLDAYMSTSGYLRYMADLVRSGYNKLEKEGSFWGAMQGALGLKEIMLDKILMQLVDLRDKSERLAKSNRDRLPGGTGIVQEMIMDMDVWKATVNLGRTFLDKVKSNKKGSEHGDTTNPINRPTPSNLYNPEFDINYNLDNFGESTNTIGWYDPYAEGTGKESLSGWDLIKTSIKDTFAKSSGQEINYRFDANYLQGAGIKLTLYDLAEHNLSTNEIESVEDFMKVIRQSPLITEPSKFLTTNTWDRVSTTLDTNNYWEIVIEPYLGLDNGFCSYLPCIDEINILNFYTHGVKTLYSRWLPIVSFDLTRSRTTTKSIGLFGGEFTIPGGIEFSNELRLTVLDDVYKSWRRYFEKCADVGVYNSRIHKKEFYGYENPAELSPNVKTPEDWKRYKISKKDAEKITVVDKNSFVLAPYKNVTFRVRIYIMTPQYSTINKYDLLATLKEVSIERAGEIDPGSQDLELSFSIVGEVDENNLVFPTPSPPPVDWDEEPAAKADEIYKKVFGKEKLSPYPPEKTSKKDKSKAKVITN